MPDSLTSRLFNALQWAHTQRRNYHVRDSLGIKFSIYFDARDDVPGFELVRALVETIERDMPVKPDACQSCLSNPCNCEVPF